VWDGRPPSGVAGTAVDIAKWQALGRETDVISLPPHAAAVAAAPVPLARGASARTIRAILYGDVQGFSGLRDDQVLLFECHVLGAIAEAVAPHAATLCYRDTWGDAIFLAFDDLAAAAHAALAIQARLTTLKKDILGLPAKLELRLAGHLGPTYDGFDPLRGERSMIGAHITRAERLEKVTPTGAVYVTEPFAAALALTPAAGIAATYVGRRPASKGYGDLRLYRLDRCSEEQEGA
jgi:class 3 adenylate cyclase